MRFAAVIGTKPPERAPAAAEFVLRLLAGEALKRAAQEPGRQPLPADLDQRVRLVGEW
jgi:hypothetical protein